MAQALLYVKPSKRYINLPGYLSPPILTGDSFRPHMILDTANKCLYIIELTVCFETNLDSNAQRKEIKYQPFLEHVKKKCRKVKFINLSISFLGISGQVSE